MHKTFFLSDPHFSHANIITFKDKEGKLIRPFNSIEEHDELIIENWNKIVRKVDRAYILGDVVIHRKALPILNRLNGRKKLVLGNHDVFSTKDYLKYFEDVIAYRVYPNLGIIFSHIPVYAGQLIDRFKFNGHGHTHQNIIPDPRYINLCCEHINYTPISLDYLIQKYNLDK